MAAATRTLADLVAEVRQRCDQENSEFVSDTELESWINQSAAALLDLVLDVAGPDAMLKTHLPTTFPGTALEAMPDDFYRVVGVDVKFNGRWCAIERAGLQDRNRFQDGGWTSPADTRYMIQGRESASSAQLLLWIPTPTAAVDARIWYLPLAITADGSTPLIAWNGWDEYVVADVAAKVLEKEESDARPLLARRDQAAARILSAARQLGSGRPLRMRDATASVLWLDEREPLWRG